jgi:hypothetical protein
MRNRGWHPHRTIMNAGEEAEATAPLPRDVRRRARSETLLRDSGRRPETGSTRMYAALVKLTINSPQTRSRFWQSGTFAGSERRWMSDLAAGSARQAESLTRSCEPSAT